MHLCLMLLERAVCGVDPYGCAFKVDYLVGVGQSLEIILLEDDDESAAYLERAHCLAELATPGN